MTMTNPIEVASYYDGVPLQHFITYRLTRLHAKLNAQASRILSEHAGITLTQWRVIALTGAKGEITLTDIHKATEMDKGQLSRTIKVMLEEELITARPSLDDQRQQILALSPKGTEIYRTMLPKMRIRQEMLMESLSSEERRVIFSAIDKLEIAAEKTVDLKRAKPEKSERKQA